MEKGGAAGVEGFSRTSITAVTSPARKGSSASAAEREQGQTCRHIPAPREALERADNFISRATETPNQKRQSKTVITARPSINPLNHPLYSTAARLTSAVHLQNGVNLPRASREASPPFWQVQPLVSRQQPGHGLEPPPPLDEEAVATEPASAFRWISTEGRASITWRKATSNPVRDSGQPVNGSAVKNGEDSRRISQVASAPFLLPFTSARSREDPSPRFAEYENRHHTVSSRGTVPSPAHHVRSRREARERIDHFIRRV